jgi:branched-subunit amino acid ABC-type transport system permease component
MTFRLYLGLALGGLPLGALYALQAMGIVLVYRTTKVFSFAQSGLAVLAAFLTASCVKHGLPVVVSALLGVAAAVIAGVGIEVTTVRHTRGPIQKTVVTLGWLLGLQGLSAMLFGLTGRAGEVLSSSKAVLNVDSIGLSVTHLDVGSYLITLAIGAGLALLLSRTNLGTAMRGVSDDPEAARLLGLPVDRVAMLSWGLGGSLAGLSGVLAAPRLGLDQTQLLVFSVASIAVALVARLESLPVALGAGLALGAGQEILFQATHSTPGIKQLAAFVVVLLALVLRRRRGRADTGGGGLAPSAIRPLPTGRSAALIAAGGLVVILGVPYLVGPTGADNLVGIGVWSLATLSVVVLAGVVGQVSICTGAFMGIGAFAAAAAAAHGVPYLLALMVGGAVAAVAAALVALPAIRLDPLELAITTISLSFAADNFLFAYAPVVSSSMKRSISVPHFLSALPAPAGSGAAGDRHLAWFCFLLFALAALAAANVRRGRTGAALTALRSSRAATAAMGFSVASAKLRGFALSGLIAGLAGGMLITHLTTLQGIGGGTGVYDTTASITLLAYAVIGGLGSLPAAIIGGVLLQLPTILAGSNPDPQITALTTTLSGVVLIVIVVLLPEGLADGIGRLGRRLRATGGAPAAGVLVGS